HHRHEGGKDAAENAAKYPAKHPAKCPAKCPAKRPPERCAGRRQIAIFPVHGAAPHRCCGIDATSQAKNGPASQRELTRFRSKRFIDSRETGANSREALSAEPGKFCRALLAFTEN